MKKKYKHIKRFIDAVCFAGVAICLLGIASYSQNMTPDEQVRNAGKPDSKAVKAVPVPVVVMDAQVQAAMLPEVPGTGENVDGRSVVQPPSSPTSRRVENRKPAPAFTGSQSTDETPEELARAAASAKKRGPVVGPQSTDPQVAAPERKVNTFAGPQSTDGPSGEKPVVEKRSAALSTLQSIDEVPVAPKAPKKEFAGPQSTDNSVAAPAKVTPPYKGVQSTDEAGIKVTNSQPAISGGIQSTDDVPVTTTQPVKRQVAGSQSTDEKPGAGPAKPVEGKAVVTGAQSTDEPKKP